MIIRAATETDLDQIAILFYETINTVNVKDYNAEQLKLWSTRDMVFWKRRFSEQYFIVAESEGQIRGFSSLTDSGYLDFMYVHKNYQRQGIANLLLKEIEKRGLELGLYTIHSHVSITAKPFFERHGFVLIKAQRKKLSGISFSNFAMEKILK